jgi:hypothetical protein
MAAIVGADSDLVSMVYVSSASRDIPPEELVEILRRSRENNERLAVTGMLLYYDGNFMQILEGPRETVTRLMSSIERDGRHRGVIVLIRKPIAERQFPQWSMAFKNLNRLAAQEREGYSEFLNGSLLDREFQAKPDRCYKLLLHFKKNMR